MAAGHVRCAWPLARQPLISFYGVLLFPSMLNASFSKPQLRIWRLMLTQCGQ